MHIEGLVSTIIPVYNRPGLVVEAIESVLAQTWRPIEILVIDDGSTDETRSVLQNLALKFHEIHLFRQENAGPGAARQVGVEAANGEFIQFLDSDDLLMPGKFEKQIAKLQENPDCGVCYGWTIRYPLGGEKNLEPVKWTGKKINTMFPSFLSDRWWDTSTPLYRAKIIHENGPWLALGQEEDWEYDCRLAAKGVNLAWVTEIVSETRVLKESSLSFAPDPSTNILSDRCTARKHILGHARVAGIERTDPNLQTFLDGSFLVARQAALSGLTNEARQLVAELNRAFPTKVQTGYFWLGKVIGFRLTTHIAERLRSLLRTLSSAD